MKTGLTKHFEKKYLYSVSEANYHKQNVWGKHFTKLNIIKEIYKNLLEKNGITEDDKETINRHIDRINNDFDAVGKVFCEDDEQKENKEVAKLFMPYHQIRIMEEIRKTAKEYPHLKDTFPIAFVDMTNKSIKEQEDIMKEYSEPLLKEINSKIIFDEMVKIYPFKKPYDKNYHDYVKSLIDRGRYAESRILNMGAKRGAIMELNLVSRNPDIHKHIINTIHNRSELLESYSKIELEHNDITNAQLEQLMSLGTVWTSAIVSIHSGYLIVNFDSWVKDPDGIKNILYSGFTTK